MILVQCYTLYSYWSSAYRITFKHCCECCCNCGTLYDRAETCSPHVLWLAGMNYILIHYWINPTTSYLQIVSSFSLPTIT